MAKGPWTMNGAPVEGGTNIPISVTVTICRSDPRSRPLNLEPSLQHLPVFAPVTAQHTLLNQVCLDMLYLSTDFTTFSRIFSLLL